MNYQPRSWFSSYGMLPRSRYGYYTSSFAWSSATMLFGTGAIVGAGLALLMAPKPGRELRHDLTRQARRLTERVRENVPALGSEDRVDVTDRGQFTS